MLNATEKVISTYVEAIRPPEEIRDKLDIGFSFENNTLIVFEIVPYFMDNSKKIERPVIKAHYIKSQKIWKLYWMRGNLKWAPYEPFPIANDIETIFRVLEEDAYGCFYG